MGPLKKAIQDKGVVSTRVLRRCGSCVVPGPKQPVIKCSSHGAWIGNPTWHGRWEGLVVASCSNVLPPGDGCSWSCGRCVFSWEMVFSNLFMFKRFWTTWTRTESSLMGVRCGYPVVFPTSFPCLTRITFPHFQSRLKLSPTKHSIIPESSHWTIKSIEFVKNFGRQRPFFRTIISA